MTLAIEQDISVQLDANRTLWLTEISRKTFQEQSLESLESDSGLFIALEDIALGTFDVLAKVASPQLGQSLLDILAFRLVPRVV